ncbi:MAG: hypothetical protein U5J83_07515 [Bryobacterales bacterium]|nr:hypothetical protein [Bryobacterales bacterium]
MDANQCNEAAIGLRDSCLADPTQPDFDALDRILRAAVDHDRTLAVAAARALIRTVVEELSDRFEPALAQCYVEIFSRAISAVQPTFSDRFLRQRYTDLRAAPTRPLAGPSPRNAIVLSRITLGADIAVTSVFIQALRARLPGATIWFAGPAKNFELFAALPNVRHWPLSYPRGGTLEERFAAVRALDGAFDRGDTWLVDPDSRISQLGLLPVAPLSSSLFFESRSFAPDSTASLGALASQWCMANLEVDNAGAVVAPAVQSHPFDGLAPEDGRICLSLGVGNNEAKRLSPRFEADLLRLLLESGRDVWVDAGAGGPEAEAVHQAIAGAGVSSTRTHMLTGSFAGFCQVIKAPLFTSAMIRPASTPPPRWVSPALPCSRASLTNGCSSDGNPTAGPPAG